jgi:hypothetical protein
LISIGAEAGGDDGYHEQVGAPSRQRMLAMTLAVAKIAVRAHM